MQQELITAIDKLLQIKVERNSIYFATGQIPLSPLAYQVDFPRLEFVISGELPMQWEGTDGRKTDKTLYGGDVLYIPAKGWNLPQWQQPVTILSLLFGKQQIGLSLLHWNGVALELIARESVARRGPRIGAFILKTLDELIWHQEDSLTTHFMVRGLLSHTLNLFNSSIKTQPRSKTLFSMIRDYVDHHYHEPLTRDSTAVIFHISPNYLSHLFQKEGATGFNEYLNYVRLERAKELLKQQNLKIKEIAQQCGYVDSNYFCRVFRHQTERTPSEYRQQYLSQIS